MPAQLPHAYPPVLSLVTQFLSNRRNDDTTLYQSPTFSKFNTCQKFTSAKVLQVQKYHWYKGVESQKRMMNEIIH